MLNQLQKVMMATIKKTAEEKILGHLKDNGQSVSWLAGKIGTNITHLHLVLSGKDNYKRNLTEDIRDKINEVLGTNF